MASIKMERVSKVMGSLSVPGDKSVSHRAVMLGAIAKGQTTIDNFLHADDCLATIDCFRKLGVDIKILDGGRVVINGAGLDGLKPYDGQLYTGNSGTTTRLISGILSGQKFTSTISGDDAVNSRPMNRIIEPLKAMGADIKSEKGGLCPLTFSPSQLKGIDYALPVASAQLKSCILLAGMYADGQTVVREKLISRNHTELMLKHFEADIVSSDNVTSIRRSQLCGRHVYVPSDISSAAFFIVAALISQGGALVIKNVGVNPTRTGIIDVLRSMGGQIEFMNYHTGAEPYADIYIKASKLSGVNIGADIMPRLIDELPAIAVAAAFASGTTTITGAKELRVKECDRISALNAELTRAGADIAELPDGLVINGTGGLAGGSELKSYGDHRIAMAMAVAAAFADKECKITGTECVSVSFPEFFSAFASVVV